MNSTPAVWLVAATLVIFGGCSEEGSDVAADSPDVAPELADPIDGTGTADTPAGSPFGASAPATDADPQDPDDLIPSGDDGPAGRVPVGTSDDTTPIAGFWDLSTIDEEGEQRRYALIADNGGVTEYDDHLDALGAPCYLAATTTIAASDDDRYDIADSSVLPGARSVDDVIIVVENGSIVFRYLGDAFDPELGAGQAGIEERFPAVAAEVAEGLVLCEMP